jgi:hypothetical protein
VVFLHGWMLQCAAQNRHLTSQVQTLWGNYLLSLSVCSEQGSEQVDFNDPGFLIRGIGVCLS